MKCPYCAFTNSTVLETRTSDDKNAVRRRRECINCKRRFTTYEKIELAPLTVTKRGGYTEPFNRDKLIGGLMRACQKRPVTRAQMEEIAGTIESELTTRMNKEVSSEKIGELVMRELRSIDEIAYVRFASVYRSFDDVDSFIREITRMRKESDNE